LVVPELFFSVRVPRPSAPTEYVLAGELQRENTGAYVDILEAIRNVAVAIGRKASGPCKETAEPGTELRAAHRKCVLAFKLALEKFPVGGAAAVLQQRCRCCKRP